MSNGDQVMHPTNGSTYLNWNAPIRTVSPQIKNYKDPCKPVIFSVLMGTNNDDYEKFLTSGLSDI